jgi:hypothetical protein
MNPHPFFELKQGVFSGWQVVDERRYKSERQEPFPDQHSTFDQGVVAFKSKRPAQKQEKRAQSNRLWSIEVRQSNEREFQKAV